MATISTISFSVARLDQYRPSVSTIIPHIDGIPLTRLISDFEKSMKFEPAGAYGGLIPEFFKYGPLDKYFLGECADGYWSDLGAIYVLGCECGEVGCWPLECQINRNDLHITWEKFRQPHRGERDYSGFGPLVFGLTQYQNALTELLANTR